ncbi:PREDICTED: suppressor of SWI4 1 homolog [Amphimedon queenslandica]|uniref:Brix domain-containing protein n=1 Tax=Amphimedon queenslandica TaxID=400682 RepID=A0A1X7V372_AMPQE|nr:PREDICTED: suppressor of SWI4 1 homolog [Amphimedon queenslandica]|eukprot:XP_003385944.1 PREDICTED: suppressor of SWI4 1 homolog [Amphimedon queenslandica]
MGKTRRKKKRTAQSEGDDKPNASKVPKTFIMERGRVGRLLNELVFDLRHVMEPNTASNLKAMKRNTLKDFVHVAGPLGVSHFILISRSDEHVNLKIAKVPRGPTLTFHITQFSTSREILSSTSRPPPISSNMFMTPPTLVLNNFSSEMTKGDPSSLMAAILQSMHQTLNVQTVKLSSLKRCVLWNYDNETGSVDFRHFAVRVVPRGTSRSVRKLSKSKIPNLSKYEDISEFILGGGASESEGEEVEGEIITPGQDIPGQGGAQQQKSAVKLYELGPRLSLKLVKIESELCTGEVLYHSYIEKSEKEAKSLRKKILEERRLKIARKREQEKNVKRKKEAKEALRRQERIRQGKPPLEAEGQPGPDVSDDDDAEWYKKEVGVAPDPELMLQSKAKKTNRTSLSSDQHRKRKRLTVTDTSFKKRKFTGTVYRRKSKK